MKASQKFSTGMLAHLREGKVLRIRAGNGQHRFIGIWFVVVQNRVFVRSWSVKANGWYRTFLKEPSGAIRIGDHEMPVRAVHIKGEHLRDAVDRAYLKRYSMPGALKYARDLCQTKSRGTTVELVPL